MTKIKTARTTEGEKFYYLGHTQAVVNDAGDSIEDLLAEQDEKIELLNDNTGVSDYPEFETSKTYKTGTIVKYEGVLYKFTADHAAGIWDSGEVKAWNINAETQEKLSELGSEVNNKLSTWDSLQNVGEYGYSSEQKKITIRISDDNIQFVPESFYGSLWVYNNSRYIYTANGLLDLDTTGIHNLLSEYDSLIYNIQKTVKGTSDLIIEHPIKKGYQYNLDIAFTNLGYITIYYLGESGNKGSEISSILYDSNSLKSNNIIANVDCFGFYIQNANSTHVTVTLNSEGTVLQDIEAIKSGLEVYTEKFSGDITLTDVLYNQNYIQSNEGIDGQDGIKIILENDGTDKKLTGWVAGGTGNKLQSFGSLLPSTLKANEKISIEFVLGTSEKIYQIWIQALDTNSQGHVYVSVLSKENRLNAIENRLKSVESISSRTTIYVGETRDYKKFTDGLKVAVEKGDVDLYVDEGDYDIIEELGEDAILKNLQAGYYGPTL